MRFRSTTQPEDLSPYGAGHIVDRPQDWRSAVIFASPHSGSIYPTDFLKRSKLSAHQLRKNEDIFIDHLFHSAVQAGAPFLRAVFPRVLVDVNRASEEVHPDWSDALGMDPLEQPTPRAAAGLGVIPTYLSESLAIYSRTPTMDDVRARLDTLYHPYHAALKALLNQSLSRFGRALLVDCHSMPGFSQMGARRPDIILGDRFGTACHADTLEQFRHLFVQAGYNVGVNYPYAGGYTTAHYGRPAEGIEAIQIEINRDIYVNPVTLAPKSGYVQLREDLQSIIQDVITQALPQDLAAQ
ncbi:N-formylglutamate amidohydrolase [Litorimonas cladophorae]|uniref:N-formylglutamate amidohydrolase n=1 Tax=Litorimonas cladophorae TaxID=1220491 RepID=A0A918KS74_9PROT|nr:N-formylglutamate amidohydrolase [Litorimonas cladophorae]GGX74048.1 N-formylglutamate amidohydrolase [Litorimonas cladophorae]